MGDARETNAREGVVDPLVYVGRNANGLVDMIERIPDDTDMADRILSRMLRCGLKVSVVLASRAARLPRAARPGATEAGTAAGRRGRRRRKRTPQREEVSA